MPFFPVNFEVFFVTEHVRSPCCLFDDSNNKDDALKPKDTALLYLLYVLSLKHG
jgi:hypothetical protein